MSSSSLTYLCDVISMVREERFRQEGLAGKKFRWTCAGPELAESDKLAVLAEEFGEVARHVAGSVADPEERYDLRALQTELVQVAAVAVAWAESIERALSSEED